MSKVIKIIMLSFVGFVLLLAVGLGLLLSHFDPNAYKASISRVFENHFGKQLIFAGDLETTFFPSIGLKSNRVFVANERGFSNQPLLSIEHLAADIDMYSLLSGKVQVEELTLVNPQINLEKSENGDANWNSFFTASSVNATDNTVPVVANATQPLSAVNEERLADSVQESDKPAGSLFRLSVLKSVRMKGLSVSYRDDLNSQSFSASFDDISLAGVDVANGFPLNISGKIYKSDKSWVSAFKIPAIVQMDTSGCTVSLDGFFIDSADADGGNKLLLQGKAAMTYDKAKKVVNIQLDSKYNQSSLLCTVDLVLPDNKRGLLKGNIKAEGVDLDELTGAVKIAAARQASDLEVKGAPNLSRVSVVHAANKTADHLSTPATDTNAGKSKIEGALAYYLEADTDIDLVLSADNLKFQNLPVDKAEMSIKSDSRHIAIPFKFDLCTGGITGSSDVEFAKHDSAALTSAKVVPQVQITAKAAKIDMACVSRAVADKAYLSGPFSADLKLSGKGGNSKELLPSLKGKATFNINSGQIQEFSLIPPELPGVQAGPASFAFENISGSFNFEKGIGISKDLTLKSAALQGTGGGNINLPFEQLDLGMDFKWQGKAPVIPMNIRGPYNALSYDVDSQQLLRNAAQTAIADPAQAKDLVKEVRDLFKR